MASNGFISILYLLLFFVTGEQMKEVSNPKLNSFTNSFSVGSAAFIARYSVNVFSVPKIWAQSGMVGAKMGLFRTSYWINRLHGPTAFHRGALVASVRAFPHYAITFVVYDRLTTAYVKGPLSQVKITRDDWALWSLFTLNGANYVSGAVAGSAATLITHPLDVVKTRLIVQPGGTKMYYAGGLDALNKIFKNEGIFRGVYRGLGLSIIGAATFWGAMFEMWHLTDLFSWVNTRPFLYLEWFFWPCVAVGTATVVSHPFDVIRRKYMVQSYVLPKEGGVDIRFKTTFQLISGMYKLNGLYGFYHGLVANCFKVAPQLAIFWLIFKGNHLLMTRNRAKTVEVIA